MSVGWASDQRHGNTKTHHITFDHCTLQQYITTASATWTDFIVDSLGTRAPQKIWAFASSFCAPYVRVSVCTCLPSSPVPADD